MLYALLQCAERHTCDSLHQSSTRGSLAQACVEPVLGEGHRTATLSFRRVPGGGKVWVGGGILMGESVAGEEASMEGW